MSKLGEKSKLYAVEIDKDLAAYLSEIYEKEPRFVISLGYTQDRYRGYF